VGSALPLVFFLALFEQPQAAPIRLQVSTHVCAAPCSLTLTVVIPSHSENRRASVVWGYDESDSTDWPLGPDTTQVEFTVPVGNLAKGNHTIYAVLLREKDGQSSTFEDSQHVTVR
jgi:hypothetical protein